MTPLIKDDLKIESNTKKEELKNKEDPKKEDNPENKMRIFAEKTTSLDD